MLELLLYVAIGITWIAGTAMLLGALKISNPPWKLVMTSTVMVLAAAGATAYNAHRIEGEIMTVVGRVCEIISVIAAIVALGFAGLHYLGRHEEVLRNRYQFHEHH